MKRSLDSIVSLFGLIFLSPLLLGLTVLIRIRFGSPVFFRQERPGKYGKPFTLIKFRTMTDDKDATGTLRSDAERLTPLGMWLRSTSLDELPELWNVLKGEMSLVGPRPLLMRYLPRYNERQARRHEVRPGITGWAQINGRNALNWDQKLELDVWYVENRSFWLDLKIIGLTFIRVLCRDGIVHDNHASMPEFMGSGNDTEAEARRQKAKACKGTE